MTADEMRRAAEYLTEQARMYRAAGAPVAATERSILAAKLRAMADADAPSGWQPSETAPRYGTKIVAWCVHDNAKYAKDPVAEGWACYVIAKWIKHNGGGWTWYGHAGKFTHWLPLPPPPEAK